MMRRGSAIPPRIDPRDERAVSAALPHNPGFAHCARRYMAMGEYGTALALVHRAQADGWEDPKFEALEKECLSYLPKVR